MYRLPVIIMCVFTASACMAKDLGVWGSIYPIAEQDIRVFIAQRLKAMQKSGALEQAKQQFIENVKKHTLRPAPVSGLTTTEEPMVFYYDPTYIVKRTVLDPNGRIMFAKGTHINPLDKIALHKVLFFFDADDTRQIKWALKETKNHRFIKFILVKGNIKDASIAIDNRVYFDQRGLLSRKLGIRHVPSLVRQKGKRLEIKENASGDVRIESQKSGG